MAQRPQQCGTWGVPMGSDIELRAEAGRAGHLALLESPSGKLWAFCEVQLLRSQREVWAVGQSGLLCAAVEQWQDGGALCH